MKIKPAILAIFLIIFSSNTPASNPNTPDIKNPDELKTLDTETKILRAQLIEAQRFQEQILSTVYWSLGSLAGIAILLVGYGWWTNFRVYERDKTSLERELHSYIIEKTRDITDKQNSIIEKQLSEIKNQLISDLENSENKISKATENLVTSTDKALNQKLYEIHNSHIDLENEVRKLNIQSKIQERIEYRTKKSYRNALQCSVTALGLANKIGFVYSIGNALDLITEDIAAAINESDRPIDNFLIGQLVNTLDAVTGSHAHAASALKTKAAQLISRT